MTAAPSMTEVLAKHRADEVVLDCLPADDGRMTWVYARHCECGWHGPSNQHAAHVAQALAAAGFGHVASVERERDGAVQAAHDEIARICQGGRWLMSIPARPGRDSDLILSDALDALEARAEAAEAQVAAVRALADEWSTTAGPVDGSYRTGEHSYVYGRLLREALDGEATP